MLIRYRTNSSINVDDFKADIDKIITGQITSVADFSDGCDKANSVVAGTYPSGIYAVANAGSNVYSKVHNEYSSITHYFKLAYGDTGLTGLTIAQDYDSSGDSLVNSLAMTDQYEVHRSTIDSSSVTRNEYSIGSFTTFWGNRAQSTGIQAGDTVRLTTTRPQHYPFRPGTRIVSQVSGTAGQEGTYRINKNYFSNTVGQESVVYRDTTNLRINPRAYDVKNNPHGIDFIITDKMFMISSANADVHLGLVDLSKNGITREFTNSMLMGGFDVKSQTIKIPYYYKLTTKSYGTLTDVEFSYVSPTRQTKANLNTAIIENPVFAMDDQNANSISTVYGIYALPKNVLADRSVYQDSNGLRRLVINNFAIVTE